MKMFLTASALVALTAVPAAAATYDVSAFSAINGTGFVTGETLTAGQSFSVNVIDPTDTWILGTSPREFTADGVEVSGANYGNYNFGGSTFAYGTLVGKIGTGDFFGIGLGGTFTAATSGVLSLFNWDSAYGDNAGSIAVDVIAPVPLPAGGLMLLSAMALGGAAAARKRRKSA